MLTHSSLILSNLILEQYHRRIAAKEDTHFKQCVPSWQYSRSYVYSLTKECADQPMYLTIGSSDNLVLSFFICLWYLTPIFVRRITLFSLSCAGIIGFVLNGRE